MKTIHQIKSELKPIHSDAEYRDYLKVIDSLVDSDENSPEEELLELISILVEDYESVHFAIEPPDPVEAIKLKMEENGLKRKDLVDYFGSPSRVSEVLNRKRPLTLEMIRRIHKGLGISAATLLAS
ncbi:helix-turn-helix domain-containing protein [Dyadobacter psychrophilus]|uniref:HTH-type transcriptional regulator / antitoxin HigA n=1 Tax=Dyadobacter psychrophilus TaxID=651661 RepID=A0A1T5H5Y3_9BACT|nr:helix-turn-helix domain-containing protein [Dyadobacter psychrophilus]SKC15991.1 HTH-type transcriptional regulator / antitoxin HigA [Dyadobacter psychrophilus]